MSAHVVVVGAGYAGVSAVKRLTREGTRVTIVNPRDQFVERIRLHQLAAGTHGARRPLRDLLPSGTELVLGTAERIDPDARTVLLRDGGTLRWDRLVYAVGSRSGTTDLPGAGEHAVTVGDLEGALGARARLDALPAGAAVTVVGGGLTGIETAAEIAETGRFAVRLVTGGGLGDGTGDRAPARLRDALERLGVDVVEHTKVTEVRADAVLTAGGRTLPGALTIAATAVELPTLAADSGLDHDPDGALRVGPDLASPSHPDIVGAGDGCRIDGMALRRCCQAAVPLGAHAAETVLRTGAGAGPELVRPMFTGRCISLGRRRGLWMSTDRFDVPGPRTMTGRPAAVLKEMVCRSTVGLWLSPRLPRVASIW